MNMNILFITTHLIWKNIGVMQLSAVLKSRGHSCKIVYSKDKDIINIIEKYSPGLIALSCSTIDFDMVLDAARKIKNKFNIPTILGGPHATFYPEAVMEECIDIICRGEGEHALLELADAIDKGKNITKIKNLWVKKNGRVFRNVVRPLINNLDSLPFPDRDFYQKEYRMSSVMIFLTSRGCPYECTFCFNSKAKSMYKNKGKYIRRRSVENIISEILEAKEKHNIKTVIFIDDVFTLDREWVVKFCRKYKKTIRLPFSIETRADLIDESLVKELKDAGCFSVEIGVETGNEKTRNTVLEKNLSDKEIENTAFLLKKHGIGVSTYNMLALPGETLEDSLKTVVFNIKLKPDHAHFNLFQPYAGLQLTKYGINKNFFSENDIIKVSRKNTWRSTISKEPNIDTLRLMGNIFVKHPSLFRFNRIIITITKNKIIRTIFQIWAAKHYMNAYNINFKGSLKHTFFAVIESFRSN